MLKKHTFLVISAISTIPNTYTICWVNYTLPQHWPDINLGKPSMLSLQIHANYQKNNEKHVSFINFDCFF